tara:strand:+ start:3379 stop:4320 length:942 start_codon:yes stop_codon:yes gene_type:complete
MVTTLRWIIGIVAVAPALFWAALTFYEGKWWVENLVSYPSLFFATYIILVVVLATMRQWAYTLVSFVFACAFWLLSPVSVQKLTEDCANPISIGQFNLLYENKNINQALSYLHNASLDLIVLQEVSPEFGERLTSLDDIYPYQYGGQEGVGYPSGQMILSRTELRNMSVFFTSDHQAIIRGIWRPNKQQSFVLITAHPPSPRTSQLWQRRNHLIEEIEALTIQYPSDEVLIVGDFNLSATSLRFARLFPSFQTAPVASWPNWVNRFKTPAQFMIAIDHLWLKSTEAGRRICSRKSDVYPNGSDHRLVVTNIGY